MVVLIHVISQQPKELIDADTLKEKQASMYSVDSSQREARGGGTPKWARNSIFLSIFDSHALAAYSNISFYMILRK